MRLVQTNAAKNRRSGTMLVLAGLCCLALIPMIGLAVDGANVYLMRNQISNALNSAVLAGIRSLNLGSNIAAQSASASTVGQMTFAADITGMNPSVSITSYPVFSVSQNSGTGIITITASASASLPLMLMGMIGIPPTTINLSATAQRRVVNIMLVLDHSGPIGGTPLADMQADANAFVKMFVNGTDNIGLVTYTGAPWLADPLPNLNFQSNVPNDISNLGITNGMTNTAAAMSTAYGQLQSLNQPGALNVIVLFTENSPGTFTGNFAQPLVQANAPCTVTTNPLNGMLWSSQNLAQIGGLSAATAASENDTPEGNPATGCTSTTRVPYRYLSAMPSTDIYGNSTNGTGAYSSAYAPYVQVSLANISAATITAAAENALDDAANQIRSNATLPATIFVIGAPGASPSVPDAVLMARVANDPTSAYYNSAQPQGEYIYAPSTAQLQTAFTGIASTVLKLLQ